MNRCRRRCNSSNSGKPTTTHYNYTNILRLVSPTTQYTGDKERETETENKRLCQLYNSPCCIIRQNDDENPCKEPCCMHRSTLEQQRASAFPRPTFAQPDSSSSSHVYLYNAYDAAAAATGYCSQVNSVRVGKSNRLGLACVQAVSKCVYTYDSYLPLSMTPSERASERARETQGSRA